MESSHNYEDSKHENTVFLCPGATYFEVDFDERCETEKRYGGLREFITRCYTNDENITRKSLSTFIE